MWSLVNSLQYTASLLAWVLFPMMHLILQTTVFEQIGILQVIDQVASNYRIISAIYVILNVRQPCREIWQRWTLLEIDVSDCEQFHCTGIRQSLCGAFLFISFIPSLKHPYLWGVWHRLHLYSEVKDRFYFNKRL